jgi:hypothetical protein
LSIFERAPSPIAGAARVNAKLTTEIISDGDDEQPIIYLSSPDMQRNQQKNVISCAVDDYYKLAEGVRPSVKHFRFHA